MTKVSFLLKIASMIGWLIDEGGASLTVSKILNAIERGEVIHYLAERFGLDEDGGYTPEDREYLRRNLRLLAPQRREMQLQRLKSSRAYYSGTKEGLKSDPVLRRKVILPSGNTDNGLIFLQFLLFDLIARSLGDEEAWDVAKTS